MKTIRIVIAVLGILGIVAWMGFRLYNNHQELEEQSNIKTAEEVVTTMPVNAARVQSRNISDTLRLQGNFEARKELDVIAEAQGRITNLYIREGQRIAKGQRVAKIDDTSLQAQLNTAKASLEKAEKDVERYERLYEAGAVSLQQLEDIRLNAKNQRTNVTNLEQRLKYTFVNAPMSGTVSTLIVEEGSFASPGMPLATVIDDSSLKLIVRVSEEDVIKLNEGQPVIVRADVYPDTDINGRIDLISVTADEGRKYKLEINVPNRGQKQLRAGMYATALFDLNGKTQRESLLIPRKSIIGSIKSPEVFVINADSTVTRRQIEVGERLQDLMEVSGGLQAGEQVVTTGQMNLRNGTKVNILQ